MKYDMVRPCAHCPFRNDIRPFLTQASAARIARSLLSDKTFSCHETINYEAMDDDDEDCGWHVPGPNERHCAGAMIILERQDNPNQMMRIAERLGMYDRTKLDMEAPVYRNFREFVDAQWDRSKAAREKLRAVFKEMPKEVTAIYQRIR